MDEIRIDINSEIFEPMLAGINEKLGILFEAMAAGEFYGGDITAKITIELQQDTKRYDRVTPEGEALVEIHEFERPSIDYKVKLILKKQSESKGSFCEMGMELAKVDGQWILRDLPDQQIRMILDKEENEMYEPEEEEDGLEQEPGREDDE